MIYNIIVKYRLLNYITNKVIIKLYIILSPLYFERFIVYPFELLGNPKAILTTT